MDLSAASGFGSPRELLQWANEAVNEIISTCRIYFQNDIAEIVVERNFQTRREVHKVKLVKPFPNLIARKATEALSNIRLSFDQAYLAGLKASGAAVKINTLHFPWARDPADLERRLGEVPEHLRPILRSVEPHYRSNSYSGGNDVIRTMAQISGRNKHIARVALSPNVVGFSPPNMAGSFGPESGGLQIPMPRWDSVKNEMVLVSCPMGLNVKNDCRLAFQIIFDETSPPFKESVPDSLRLFSKVANDLVNAFERACP